MEISAYAKINITLDVLGKRPDGYHDVRMIMQTIALHDTLSLSAADGEGKVFLESNLAYLPTDERNVAYKAARVFLETMGLTQKDLHIRLKKRIPVAAGLAGGSTNAAAVLKGLNRLFETGLSKEELCDLASPLGADIPYCILGGTVLAEGIGEALTPLPPMPRTFVLLVKPKFSLSTPKIYQILDQIKIRTHPDTAGAIEAIRQKDLDALSHRMYNVLFEAIPRGKQELESIQSKLLQYGAAGTIMSGSGPATFGFFKEEADAFRAYRAFREQYPETFLTCTVQNIDD